MSDPTDTPPAPPPVKRAGNRGVGRKPSLTPEIRDEIIKAVGVGDSNINAAAAAGIGQSTLYAWIEKGTDRPEQPATETSPAVPAYVGRSPYREFVEALSRARPKWRRALLGKTAEAVEGDRITHYDADGKITKVEKRAPDGRLALKLLALRYPAEFAEKVVVENRHTNASGTGPVLIGSHAETVAALRTMTPEQLRAITGTDTSDLAPLPEGDGADD
jgi:transposase-like protein